MNERLMNETFIDEKLMSDTDASDTFDTPQLWKLTLQSSFEQTEHLAAQLEDDCLLVSWFEHVDASPLRWQLEAIFDHEPEAQWLNLVMANQDYTLGLLPNCNWLRQNRQSFPVLHVGQFYIYGSHHNLDLPPTNLSLKIDAATAFGTGQHGTTQGCLRALEDLKNKQREKNLKINKVLDLGCGTAILAMAMGQAFQLCDYGC